MFFPISCVAVVYNSKKNKQHHLFNSSKKPLSCLAYSGDGRFLATGEVVQMIFMIFSKLGYYDQYYNCEQSGHQPAVRVWDLEEMTQVAEFEGHKFGIRCVVSYIKTDKCWFLDIQHNNAIVLVAMGSLTIITIGPYVMSIW